MATIKDIPIWEAPLEVGKLCPICGRMVYFTHQKLCVAHGDKELALHDFRNWAYSEWPYKTVKGWDYSYR